MEVIGHGRRFALPRSARADLYLGGPELLVWFPEGQRFVVGPGSPLGGRLSLRSGPYAPNWWLRSEDLVFLWPEGWAVERTYGGRVRFSAGTDASLWLEGPCAAGMDETPVSTEQVERRGETNWHLRQRHVRVGRRRVVVGGAAPRRSYPVLVAAMDRIAASIAPARLLERSVREGTPSTGI